MESESGSLNDQEKIEAKHIVENTTARMTNCLDLPRTGWSLECKTFSAKTRTVPDKPRWLVTSYGPPF